MASAGQSPAMAARSEVVSMRRLTEQEYRNSIADIFGRGISVQGVFEPMAKKGCGSPMIAALAESTPNLVIGVDRLDYSKGLGLKFEAFEHLLKKRPEWSGHVTFLQITPKSRSAIALAGAKVTSQQLDQALAS